MKRGGFAFAVLLSASAALAGCEGDEVGSDDNDVTETQDVFGSDRVSSLLKNAVTKIPGDFVAYEALFKVGRACPRKDSKEIYVIEEDSTRATGEQEETDQLMPRAVVTGCNLDKSNPDSVRNSFNLMAALVSSPDAEHAAAGDPMILTPLEVMALDDKTGLYNFYVFESNGTGKTGTLSRIQRQPNGDVKVYKKEPGKSVTSSMSEDGRCFNCHVNGGPIMNELTEPWTNWVSTHKKIPESKLSGQTLSIVGESAAPHGEHNRSSLANDLEQTMRASVRTWVSGTTTAKESGHGSETLLGVQPGGLPRLLESVFCQTELNFASATDSVPLELFIDPGAVTSAGLLKPAAYASDVFPIQLPVRSEMDRRIELFLQKGLFLSARTITAVRVYDDEHDIFSSKRCALLTDVKKALPTKAAEVDAHIRTVLAAHASSVPAGVRADYFKTLVDPKKDDAAVTAARAPYYADVAKRFAKSTSQLTTATGRKKLKTIVSTKKKAASTMFPDAANPLPVLD